MSFSLNVVYRRSSKSNRISSIWWSSMSSHSPRWFTIHILSAKSSYTIRDMYWSESLNSFTTLYKLGIITMSPLRVRFSLRSIPCLCRFAICAGNPGIGVMLLIFCASFFLWCILVCSLYRLRLTTGRYIRSLFGLSM